MRSFFLKYGFVAWNFALGVAAGLCLSILFDIYKSQLLHNDLQIYDTPIFDQDPNPDKYNVHDPYTVTDYPNEIR